MADQLTASDVLVQRLIDWGPVIVECVVDPHEPPIPAKVKKDQAEKLATAPRAGMPNRNRIALQMVKDLLDESSFDASPGHAIPGRIGEAVSGVVGKLRDTADAAHRDEDNT